ncbi:porin [Candidatus Pelagibacter sp.]|uniref:porin n=1 Tax=Candidatus Pelagibacter sp. TaxID=2024849 RepID=UPI003F836CFF
MNNLKKVGLTALATTLVSTASVAGELSVSGGAALSYTGLSTNSDVNPWAMGDSVKFNGGGDLDNGMTVSVYYELDGGTYDDYNLKLGMGDMGTLSFSGNSSSGSGVDKLKDIVPNAYTPVYEATDATDSGLIDASGNNQAGQWGYDITVGNAALSASYNPEPGGNGKEAETGFAIVYSGLMDGLELSAGYFDDGDEAENDTMGIKYTMGALTAAYQMTKVDYAATGTADQDATHVGVSIAVNDSLSVSAGQQSIEFDGTAEDEKNSGIGASYTMGSISMYGGFNKLENANGSTASADVEASIFNISFAF